MMKLQTLIAPCLLFLLCANVQAVDLSPIGDKRLVRLLNDYELLAEIKGLPYAVKVLRLANHGECDGTPQSCPKETLYIAVSGFDEDPDQRLYVLPEAHGWKFIKWGERPKTEGRTHFVTFEVKKQIISSNPKRAWWAYQKYTVRVNPWKAYLKKKK